jgi:hypothetical protein
MTMEQPTLTGIPALPPARSRGRPTKVAAEEHARVTRDAVLAGTKAQRRSRAQARAEQGIATTEAHTVRVMGSTWMDQACELVLEFGRPMGSAGFIMEDARIYAYGKLLPKPPEERVWGAVTKRLSSGTAPAITRIPGTYGIAASSNNSPKPKWKVL